MWCSVCAVGVVFCVCCRCGVLCVWCSMCAVGVVFYVCCRCGALCVL